MLDMTLEILLRMRSAAPVAVKPPYTDPLAGELRAFMARRSQLFNAAPFRLPCFGQLAGVRPDQLGRSAQWLAQFWGRR